MLRFLRLPPDQETAKPIVAQSVLLASIQLRVAIGLPLPSASRDTERVSITGGARSVAGGLAALFSRDLTRLIQELEAFPSDETLWQRTPGVKNSAGNLVLHLEGNLREYVGRQLGRVPYSRTRDQEFLLSGLSREDLMQRMESVKDLVTRVVSRLSESDLAAEHPEQVLEISLSSHDLLVHLHGHLNFHLGQIDYLRRILTEGSAVAFAGL